MTQPTHRNLDERVSRAGPEAAEVLKALLNVDPNDEPADAQDADDTSCSDGAWRGPRAG